MSKCTSIIDSETKQIGKQCASIIEQETSNMLMNDFTVQLDNKGEEDAGLLTLKNAGSVP